MAAADYVSVVQQLYVAYFGRPADTSGIANFTAQLDALGVGKTAADLDAAYNSNATVRTLVDQFGTSAESLALYGTGTTEAFLTQIYANVLNRAPDAAGLAWWKDQIDNGGLQRGKAALAIAAGALANTTPQGLLDKALVETRIAVATNFTTTITSGNYVYDGNDAAAAARTMLSTVTGTTDVTAFQTNIESTLASITPSTVTLTTGVDTVAAAAGMATINGVISALVAENTLNATDVIDAGDGVDTLKVDMKSNFAGFTGTGKLANVENVVLTNATAIARTFDATGVTGTKSYTLDSKQGISLTSLESTGLTVVEKGAQTNVSIGFKTGLALTGTTDAMSLEVQGVGAAKTDSTAQVNPKITLAGIEVVDLKSAGSANFVDLSGVSELTTLTVTGDQALTVSDVANKVTKVDGSAATGNLDLALSVGTAAAVTSVKTGSGNDVVKVDAADLQANAVVAGGAGTDVLTLNDTAAAGSTIQLNQSGFETLKVTGVTTAKTLTMSGTNTTDVTTVQLDANAVANGAVSLVNMGAGDLTVKVVGGADAGQALTVDNAGIVTANVDTTTKQAAASATATGATVTSASAVTASNAANVTFNVGKYVTQTGDLVANKATSVTLNVASGKNAAVTPAELTSFSGDLDALKATSVTVNAEGKLDGAEINATVATSAVINTGATASTADLILTKATDLQLTAKGDFTALNAASNLAAVQSATLATDGAMIIDTTLADIASLTISGANTKSSFDNNSRAVGGAAMDHTMVVTATGLKAGFTLDGTIASKQAITITSSGVTGTQAIGTAITGLDVTLTSSGAVGAVTYGNIDAATDGTGTATVNAKGNTGNIAIGTIGAATQHKAVSVDVSGSLGTVGIGEIKSDGSVTVNAANTLKAVTLNDGLANGTADITAVTGVNVSAGLKALAFDAAIANTATSGAFAGVINGSIEADEYRFLTTGDAKADITLSGDMGLGTDVIVVSAASVTTVDATKTVKIDISGLSNYDGATLTGGANADLIKGSSGVDAITGGTGADVLTGGAGADTFIFSTDGSLAAAMDSITDFAKASDVIDFGATVVLLAAETNGTTATSDVDTSAGGLVSFAAADDTLTEQVAAIQADTQLDAINSVAFWVNGNDTYVYYAGAATGNTDDQIVKLVGVTGLTTITVDGAGNLTIA